MKMAELLPLKEHPIKKCLMKSFFFISNSNFVVFWHRQLAYQQYKEVGCKNKTNKQKKINIKNTHISMSFLIMGRN